MLSVRFRKCLVTYTPHYGLIRSTFIFLKISCTPPFQPPSFLIPGDHSSFSCLHGFAFSGRSYGWTHTVCSLFRLASFMQRMILRFFHVFLSFDSSFLFLALGNGSLSRWNTTSLSIHLLKDISVALSFGCYEESCCKQTFLCSFWCGY